MVSIDLWYRKPFLNLGRSEKISGIILCFEPFITDYVSFKVVEFWVDLIPRIRGYVSQALDSLHFPIGHECLTIIRRT